MHDSSPWLSRLRQSIMIPQPRRVCKSAVACQGCTSCMATRLTLLAAAWWLALAPARRGFTLILCGLFSSQRVGNLAQQPPPALPLFISPIRLGSCQHQAAVEHFRLPLCQIQSDAPLLLPHLRPSCAQPLRHPKTIRRKNLTVKRKIASPAARQPAKLPPLAEKLPQWMVWATILFDRSQTTPLLYKEGNGTMNAVRSQTKDSLVEQLRREHQEKLARAYLTGQTPMAHQGDPVFEDALSKRRKLAAATRDAA